MDTEKEKLVVALQSVIFFAVRILAVLMTFVIIWGVADVCLVLYRRLVEPPFMLLNVSDLLATFGAFLAVLISIEIFINITIYLKEEIIHVKIVLATALMAIARKVIVFDFKELQPLYIFASAAVILALGIAYWLITARGSEAEVFHIKHPKS
jgi:uncharacterized membrane protein (DUF373 family)